jgi:hypothetical protein
MGRRKTRNRDATCIVCGRPYQKGKDIQQTCCRECGSIVCWSSRYGMTIPEYQAYLAQRKAEKLSPSKKARKEAMRPIPNPQAGPRVCLCCNRTFPSTGPGNRICERCAASEEATPCRIHTAHIREG